MMKKILLSLLFIPSLLMGQNTIWNKSEATAIGSNDLFFFSVSNVVKKLKAQTVIDVVQDSARAYIATGGITITSNTGIQLSGAGTVWEDLRVPIVQGKTGITSKPDFDYTEIAYAFPQNDTTEVLYIIVQMPHSYKEGSTIYPHLHFKSTSSIDFPDFKILYKWFDPQESVPATFKSLDFSDAPFSPSSGLHQIVTNNSGISGTGMSISSIMLIQLKRKTGDGIANDVMVYEFDIHYEIDALGSKTETAK